MSSNQSKHSQITSASAMVANVMQLISLPEVYLRLQSVIDDPQHTRQQVAEVIAYDPGLSARLLRIANSAYYSFPSQIDSVATAVKIIGESDLRNIVLAMSVVTSMASLDQTGIDLDIFWFHSVRCALVAQILGKKLKLANSETLFLAGMLHDLGQLVLYRGEEELAREVAWLQLEKNIDRSQAELQLIGFDHAEVGGLLVEAWGLPAQICKLVRYHHAPELVAEESRFVFVIALANKLTQSETGEKEFSFETDPEIQSYFTALSIENAEVMVAEIMEESGQQCAEIMKLICER